MPFICCQTNVNTSPETARKLKARLGKAIEAVPGKREELLMVSLIEGCFMSYRGDCDAPIAFVELRILAEENANVDFAPVSKEIVCAIRDELAIPVQNINVTFLSLPQWGLKSDNQYLLRV